MYAKVQNAVKLLIAFKNLFRDHRISKTVLETSPDFEPKLYLFHVSLFLISQGTAVIGHFAL